MTALRKFFHYSPKRTESLKEVQRVLDLPELKIIKPSDTRWLAHERCVKGVKASYAAILLTIFMMLHVPEALGLSKALSKKQTTAAIFLLDYTLPQVAKLNKTLQTENLDLLIVASLVDSTLHTLEDAVTPAANWVLELLEECVNLETIAIATLKDNISLQGEETVKKAMISPDISTEWKTCSWLSNQSSVYQFPLLLPL